MRFAPEYVSSVLNEHFEDAKELFLSPLMAIHHAHLVMLAACGIVRPGEARRLRDGLDRISLESVRQAVYDGSCEDLFFFLHGLLAAACGEDSAGRLGIAVSRNDIDMTMYRMRLREFLLELASTGQALRRVLIGVAERHRGTLLAAHTHAQPAQPTTVAHYVLAAVEQSERDDRRLRAAYETTNRCPLGACAITGTGFPIDRTLTSALLGFDAPTGNTYGSIATVDYLLESVAAASVTVSGVGRVVQDLLLWCTPEFGYLRLSDGFVQASSIMPQKRNPVALEHARAIASKALGEAAAVTLAVHNTPFGDIVDTEDDLQPLVHATFRDAARALRLVAAALEGAEFDVERLNSLAGQRGATLTELADSLTRDRGVPLRTAQAIAARFGAIRQRRPAATLADALAEAAKGLTDPAPVYEERDLERLLSPKHFVEVRCTSGGPSPQETERAIEESRRRLAADDGWWAGARDALLAAQSRLAQRSAAL